MSPYESARKYAQRSSARLLELESGHFAMLVDAERTERALFEFLEEQTR